MKRRTLIFATLGLPACSAEDASFEAMLDDLLEGTVPQLSTEALASEEALVLLDSRTPEEFDQSHLEGARWVGFDEFDLTSVADLDLETPIVVYCSVGKRSELIGEQLLSAGYENVRNLRGGLFQWANEGRPMVDANGPANTVHPYNRKWGRWLTARH